MRGFLAAAALALLLASPAHADLRGAGLPPNGDGSGVGVTATGGTTALTLANRFAEVFHITDYGAKCDGSTNDNAAINAAFLAASNSAAYTNNNAVAIVGPAGASQRGCVVNSINATIFQRGTGANLRPRVEISDMTLLCTGAGNVCFDALGSDLIKVHDVSIRGDSVAPPEICIQVGLINSTSSAWHSFERVNCSNEFTFTALYNFGSEANAHIDAMYANAHTSSGPIGTLGAVTGGSSYTNGTYTGVALTGGVGTGALATVVVAGNAVSTVTITYQGRDYAPSDSLSAAAASIGGTGSGFSVPVSTVTPYGVVLDGQNHWRAASAFQTETLATDAWQSLTLNSFINSSIRQLGSGPAMWVAWTGGLHVFHSYLLANTGTNCLTIFDNGVTKGGIPGPNWGLDLDFNCEGLSLASMIQLSGANNTPILQDFRYRGYHLATGSTFKTDSNITAATMRNADIDMKFASSSGVQMFASAKLWTVSGRVAVPTGSYWNAPAAFQGNLVVGSVATPPNLGPVDILSGAAQAVSCARLLVNSYTGALCQVERTSDSTSIDMYPDGFGNLDRAAFQSFCNGTTCKVAIAYDQSGNGNNFTQATVASQPTLTLALAALGNRPAMLFGDQSAIAMTATQASTINNLFATGGYASVVVNTTGNANAADRVLYKSNGGGPGIGWDFRCNFVGTSLTFVHGSSTADGVWATTAPGTGSLIYDLQYSYASLANVPAIGINGSAANNTATQPTGTVGSDAAINLLLGNNAATAGTRGFPGYIAESILWKTTPTAAQLEAIRRNQANYYGVASVN